MSIAAGAVSGKSASAQTMGDVEVGQERLPEDERDDRDEAEEARVLLRLAIARARSRRWPRRSRRRPGSRGRSRRPPGRCTAGVRRDVAQRHRTGRR